MFQFPAITCSSLERPRSGSVSCTRSGTQEDCRSQQCPYDTRCTYGCNTGYQLIGATSTRCQGLTHPGSWSSSKPSCRGKSRTYVNQLDCIFVSQYGYIIILWILTFPWCKSSSTLWNQQANIFKKTKIMLYSFFAKICWSFLRKFPSIYVSDNRTGNEAYTTFRKEMLDVGLSSPIQWNPA